MSRVVSLSLITTVSLFAACRDRDDRAALPIARDVAARPAAALSAAPATAADLARDLDDADRRSTWSEVRQRWEGRRVRWTVTRQRVLCGSADACHVMAMPVERPARHGWLPGLTFAPGGFDALAAACAQDPCDVTISGTIAQVVSSPDQPQSVKLADVVVDARVAAR